MRKKLKINQFSVLIIFTLIMISFISLPVLAGNGFGNNNEEDDSNPGNYGQNAQGQGSGNQGSNQDSSQNRNQFRVNEKVDFDGFWSV